MPHNQFEHIAVRRVVISGFNSACSLSHSDGDADKISQWHEKMKSKHVQRKKTHKYSLLKPEVHSGEAERSSDFWCNLSSIKMKKKKKEESEKWQTVKCI